MNARHVATFRAVMASRSTTDAAKSLGVSQPAVSKALKELEDELRIRLFERLAGRLRPTPEAHLLESAACAVMNSLDGFERLANEIREQSAATLTLAAIPILANKFFPDALLAFRARRPDVKVTIQVAPRERVADLVMQREAEIGMVQDTVEEDDLRTEDLAEADVVCIMPDDHPLCASPRISLADLSGHTVVSYPPNGPLGSRIRAACEAAGVTLQVRTEVGASTVLCSVVSQGGGIGIIERYGVIAEYWPNLVVRPLAERILVRPRFLMVPGRPLSTVAKEFLGHYRAVFVRSLAQ